MIRAILVGVASALLVLTLLSVSVYVEMRHTRLGEFTRDSAVELRTPHVSGSYMATYRDPLTYLGKWVRVNQMLVDPALCVIVGLLIGAFTRHVTIASTIAVVPVLVLNSPPDCWAALSICICAVGCWSTATATRRGLGRLFATDPRPA